QVERDLRRGLSASRDTDVDGDHTEGRRCVDRRCRVDRDVGPYADRRSWPPEQDGIGDRLPPARGAEEWDVNRSAGRRSGGAGDRGADADTDVGRLDVDDR